MTRKPRPDPALDRVRALRDGGPTLPPGGGPGDPGDPGGGEVVRLIADPKDPCAIAEQFATENFLAGGYWQLVYDGGRFRIFDPAAGWWRDARDRELENLLLRQSRTWMKPGRGGAETVRCPANERVVKGVLFALPAIVPNVTTDRSCWLPRRGEPAEAAGADQPPAAEFFAVANGLLHVASGEFGSATPAYYSRTVCPVPFDPEATCKTWLATLGQWFDDDRASIDTLQQLFGWYLAPEPGLELEKIGVLLGPPRAGKSKAAELLVRLVGADNACFPTLSSFAKPFGRQALLGKKLALLPDARLGRFADSPEIVQALLSISGGDRQGIDRKHEATVNARLDARFLLVTNELPSLGDAAGAFGSRIVVLQFVRSFLGREDDTLLDRLTAELSGILNWALAGWARLKRQGRFVQPASGETALAMLKQLSSDIEAFVAEECEIGKNHMVSRKEIFSRYNEWRKEQGLDTVSQPRFGQKLKAAIPSLEDHQPRQESGLRPRFYRGVKLRTELL